MHANTYYKRLFPKDKIKDNCLAIKKEKIIKISLNNDDIWHQHPLSLGHTKIILLYDTHKILKVIHACEYQIISNQAVQEITNLAFSYASRQDFSLS